MHAAVEAATILRQPDKTWLALVLWIAASIAAAAFGTSLTWDGAYYFISTLDEGRAFIEHHRYANFLLLEPVAMAFRALRSIPAALIVHGVLCAATGWLAFLGILLWAKPAPAVRLWLVAGLVLTPLPGMINATMEITPVLQTFWLLLAAAWFAPRPWAAIVAVLGSIWMCLLHPIAVPLLAFACLAAIAAPRQDGGRAWGCAAIFGLTSVLRFAAIPLAATAYERSQIDAGVAQIELIHMLKASPWWLTLAGCAIVWLATTGKLSAKLEWCAWILLTVAGVCWMSDPERWSGALNYRKFAFLFVLPFLLPTVWAMRKGLAAANRNAVRTLLCVAMAASLTWLSGAFSWNVLLGAFKTQVAQAPAKFVREGDGVSCVQNTALDHWSATPLCVILLGRETEHLFLGKGVVVENNQIILFPGQIDFAAKAIERDWVSK